MSKQNDAFIVVTTPMVAGYKIKKVLGAVIGVAPRTRGVGGRIQGKMQSLTGGEVVAFTSEIEKAHLEAMERVKTRAIELGANAIVGLDVEITGMGATNSILLFLATGTAVLIEPES